MSAKGKSAQRSIFIGINIINTDYTLQSRIIMNEI
jgi:hypothetical protein